jgi:hypothetical protein
LFQQSDQPVAGAGKLVSLLLDAGHQQAGL